MHCKHCKTSISTKKAMYIITKKFSTVLFHTKPAQKFHHLYKISMTSNVKKQPQNVSFRKIAQIDINNFCHDISNSPLYFVTTDDVNEMVALYNDTLSNLLDLHAPLITKQARHTNPWFTPDLKKRKAACRKAERKWRRTHSSTWKTALNLEYKIYRSAIA